MNSVLTDQDCFAEYISNGNYLFLKYSKPQCWRFFSAAERDIGINIHCWIRRRKYQRISLIELLFMRMFNKMTSKRFITFQWSSLVTDKEQRIEKIGTHIVD